MSTTPVPCALEKTTRLARDASDDRHLHVYRAGIPTPQNPPNGLASIRRQGAGGGIGVTGGLTLVPNAAAFQIPVFRTENVVVRNGNQVQHFAVVQRTTSSDVSIQSLYPAPGDHLRTTQRIGNVTYTHYWRISPQVSQLIQRGEQEHLDDALRAYTLTYKLIADQINMLAGQRFGPAATPGDATQLAEAALARQLPLELGVDPANWVRVFDRLLLATKTRDTNGWHSLRNDPSRTEGTRIIEPVVPEATTRIGQVSSSQVVRY